MALSNDFGKWITEVEKTVIFAEGTDANRVMQDFCRMGIKNVRAFTVPLEEVSTGKHIMNTVWIKGCTIEPCWELLTVIYGLTTIDDPEYKNHYFAVEK